MPEVPDHLVPTDGLCNYGVRLGSVVTGRRGAAAFLFEIHENDTIVATIPITVGARDDGLYGLYARAHSDLRDVFRQLVHVSDTLRVHYETEGVRRSQPAKTE